MPSLGAGRAREQLVPGREAGALAIDRDLERRRSSLASSRGATRRISSASVGRARARRPSRLFELLDRRLERAAIGALGPGRGVAQEARADLEVDRDVLPGVEALREVALPRAEAVDPRAHRVLVAPEPRDAEVPAEDVVALRLDRHLGPGRLVGVAVEDRARDQVVPVGEGVARTSTRSPTVRLTGKRPPSTTGSTPSITTRSRPPGRAGSAGAGRPGQPFAQGPWERHTAHSAVFGRTSNLASIRCLPRPPR